MADFEVRGAEDVDKLVRALARHADAKALRKELLAGLNRESKDVRAELKEAIPLALPRRGGLAAEVAKTTTFNASAKSGKYAGVTIWARNRKHDIRTLTGRRLRHPVFGNRNTWVTQTEGVNGDALGEKFQDQKPNIQRALYRVMEDIARKITGHI